MAISYIGNSIVGSTNNSTVTSGNLNTTTATLLVVSVGVYFTTPTAGMLADQGVGGTNSWTALTDNFDGSYPLHQRQFYCVSPTKTGASHSITFNPAGGATFPIISFYAFAGTALSSVFDAESGANSGTSTTLVTLQATTTITPAGDGEVLVTGLTGNYFGTPTCNDGFSGHEVSVNSTSTNIALATSYQIQTTATARRPTWSFTSGYPQDLSVAAFKAPAGSSGGPSPTVLDVILGQPQIMSAGRSQ